MQGLWEEAMDSVTTGDDVSSVTWAQVCALAASAQALDAKSYEHYKQALLLVNYDSWIAEYETGNGSSSGFNMHGEMGIALCAKIPATDYCAWAVSIVAVVCPCLKCISFHA